MKTEFENTVQDACERLEQTINNSVQGLAQYLNLVELITFNPEDKVLGMEVKT